LVWVFMVIAYRDKKLSVSLCTFSPSPRYVCIRKA
jgi:hypothetical protein